eukprot:3280950-Pleurochrysis_carterae.AAC.1
MEFLSCVNEKAENAHLDACGRVRARLWSCVEERGGCCGRVHETRLGARGERGSVWVRCFQALLERSEFAVCSRASFPSFVRVLLCISVLRSHWDPVEPKDEDCDDWPQRQREAEVEYTRRERLRRRNGDGWLRESYKRTRKAGRKRRRGEGGNRSLILRERPGRFQQSCKG